MRDDRALIIDISEATKAVLRFCSGRKKAEYLKDEMFQSGVLHQLMIIGEATKLLSPAFKENHPQAPWKLMAGMRDRIAHGYFNIDLDEVWRTATHDIPELSEMMEGISRAPEGGLPGTSPIAPEIKSSPKPDDATTWRLCPLGQHWRREHFQPTYRTSKGKIVRGHPVSAGCAENPSKKDRIYPEEMKLIAEKHFVDLSGPPSANNLGFGEKGAKYDSLIRGWTRYWNDVLEPDVPLDADLVKALIASESGFRINPPGSTKARGLMQLEEISRRALGGFKGELKDHLVHFEKKEILDPILNIGAGVRWLFQKKRLAGGKLGRAATWDEAVAEYKDILQELIRDPKTVPRLMRDYRDYYKRLK